MKKLFLSILVLTCLYASYAWAFPSCQVEWLGGIGEEFYQQAKKDLAKGCAVLQVRLTSPGGGVLETLEIVREMERAKARGTRIEIYARTMVASGATLVLGAGSVGYRVVDPSTIELVHGIRTSMSGCLPYKEHAVTEDDKITNAFIEILVREYAALSGKTIRETFPWLDCENSLVGTGSMLVSMGLADRVERL